MKMSLPLISIRKKYCEKIFSGEKIYEFRKMFFRENTSVILINESNSTNKFKIIGTIKIKKILELDIDKIRDLVKANPKACGVTLEEIEEYYKNKKSGYIYCISSFKKCRLDPTEFFNRFKAPQNVIYVESEKILEHIEELDKNKKILLKLLKQINKKENEFKYISNMLKQDNIQVLCLKNKNNILGYTAIDRDENSILMLFKTNKEIEYERLLSFALKNLDQEKEICFYANSKSQKLIDFISKNNFQYKEIATNFNSKDETFFKFVK